MKLNIINFQDFSFNLYKKELNVDVAIENLYDEVNKLKNEIKEIKEK